MSKILVVEGHYYEIPDRIKDDAEALAYIDEVGIIPQEDLEDMLDGHTEHTTERRRAGEDED